MAVGGQRHAPAALPPGKTRYPLYRTLGGTQERSGLVRKIFPPPGFDPRTVLLVASRYTEWTIPAPRTSCIKQYIEYVGVTVCVPKCVGTCAVRCPVWLRLLTRLKLKTDVRGTAHWNSWHRLLQIDSISNSSIGNIAMLWWGKKIDISVILPSAKLVYDLTLNINR